MIKDPYSEFLVAEDVSVQKERVTEDFNDQYWDQHCTIERERIPVFLERVAENILRTEKYLNVLWKFVYNIYYNIYIIFFHRGYDILSYQG